MVICEVPGVSAEIHVNGVPLKEYETIVNPDNAAKCYIATTPEANFAVKILVNHKYQHKDYDLKVYLFVDGEPISHRVLEKSELQRITINHPAKRTIDSKGVEVNGIAGKRRFQFASLVTDDSPLKDQHVIEQAKNLGKITLTFVRTRCIDVRVPQGGKSIHAASPAAGPKKDVAMNDVVISEKALKGRALSYKASFGEFEASPASRTARPMPTVKTWEKIDSMKSPLATLEFNYRSLSDLEAECIIPRLEDRPAEDLTAEELRELLRRQREREARGKPEPQQVPVKSEAKHKRDPSNGVDGDDEIEVLERPPVKRIKGPQELEEIDLTGE
ncbi:hypothetical protein EJ08DRAFT_683938 [Tothia fuscella]|uniref:DUF7918 domain-containing protein n=1 Tax=Tothia fuscella TaxID=1048955 RepID=A0A9P4NF36_9PEZI|nr:hypothetical protein EJ08DRAFT_683938 [Tothia fuscella]